MSIQQRLQLVIKMHHLSPSAFADKIGVQRSNVSHVLSGRNKPSLDFLEKIILHFPRVNAHWLITGKMPGQSTDDGNIIQSETRSVEKVSPGTEHDSLTGQEDPVKIIEFFADNSYRVSFPRKR